MQKLNNSGKIEVIDFLRGMIKTMSFKNIVEKFIGTYSDRELKKIYPIMNKVLSLEETMQKKSDAELRAMTDEFKERLRNGETTDDILPEAFAVCIFLCRLLVVLFSIRAELPK